MEVCRFSSSMLAGKAGRYASKILDVQVLMGPKRTKKKTKSKLSYHWRHCAFVKPHIPRYTQPYRQSHRSVHGTPFIWSTPFPSCELPSYFSIFLLSSLAKAFFSFTASMHVSFRVLAALFLAFRTNRSKPPTHVNLPAQQKESQQAANRALRWKTGRSCRRRAVMHCSFFFGCALRACWARANDQGCSSWNEHWMANFYPIWECWTRKVLCKIR